MMRVIHVTSALVVLMGAAGCDLLGPTTQPSTNPAATRPVRPAFDVTVTPTGPSDGQPIHAALTHLDVYLVDVPYGSISGDESFWRAVDENAIGAAADQRLQANGIRCGVALRSRWPRFAEIINREMSRSRRMKSSGTSTQTITLDLDQAVDHENVFVVNADGHLEGRTYDHALNGVALTFGPTPRVAGSVRLSFCPTVRRDVRRLEFTPMNQEYEVPQTDVVRVYDAGLTADVPADGFFIVAPGPLALDADRLGGRFLIRGDAAARHEQVIIAVPMVVRLDGSTRHVAEQGT